MEIMVQRKPALRNHSFLPKRNIAIDVNVKMRKNNPQCPQASLLREFMSDLNQLMKNISAGASK